MDFLLDCCAVAFFARLALLDKKRAIDKATKMTLFRVCECVSLFRVEFSKAAVAQVRELEASRDFFAVAPFEEMSVLLLLLSCSVAAAGKINRLCKLKTRSLLLLKCNP